MLRLNKQTLFDLVHYTPHDGQRRVHESIARRRILAAGVRWGKSMCAGMEALAALLEPKQRSLGWIVAPTFDTSSRVFASVAEVATGHFRHRVREFLPREHKLVVLNLGGGISTLEGKSADSPVNLLGVGLDYLVIDEAARIKREIWTNHLSQRLVDRNGWALIISTPRGAGWFFELFRRGENGRVKDYESWRAPSWSNPYLSRAVIEAERENLTPDQFRQEYGAEFVDAHLAPCWTCGGPSRKASGLAAVKAGRELPRCHECGLETDEAGKTIVLQQHNGQPYFKRVVLPDDGAASPFIEFLPLDAHLKLLAEPRPIHGREESAAQVSAEPHE